MYQGAQTHNHKHTRTAHATPLWHQTRTQLLWLVPVQLLEGCSIELATFASPFRLFFSCAVMAKFFNSEFILRGQKGSEKVSLFDMW